MKKILIIVLPVLLIAGISCESESKDGFYDGTSRIYFPHDSLHYSFGDKSLSQTTYTYEFPVKSIGFSTNADRQFKLVAKDLPGLPKYDPSADYDPDVMTLVAAEPGVHYLPLESHYTLLPDSVNGYAGIVLLRENLPDGEENIQFVIALELQSSADFELGVTESQTSVLTFNNYLQEPEWWSNVYGSAVIHYRPGMYIRIMEYYGGVIERDYAFSNYLDMMLMLKTQVYDYAMEHPELGWEFYSYIWWPFE